MDFKSELFESIKNKMYLISILGVDIDSILSTERSYYFSIPEVIKVTEKYIESEVNLKDIKVSLNNFQSKDNMTEICKQLLKELTSEIYTLCILSTSDEVNTEEDFNLLKESADEFIEQKVKYFSKIQTGKVWNDDSAKEKIKCVKHNLHNMLIILNKPTEYKEV